MEREPRFSQNYDIVFTNILKNESNNHRETTLLEEDIEVLHYVKHFVLFSNQYQYENENLLSVFIFTNKHFFIFIFVNNDAV